LSSDLVTVEDASIDRDESPDMGDAINQSDLFWVGGRKNSTG
jgi:hypothetical protein